MGSAVALQGASGGRCDRTFGARGARVGFTLSVTLSAIVCGRTSNLSEVYINQLLYPISVSAQSSTIQLLQFRQIQA